MENAGMDFQKLAVCFEGGKLKREYADMLNVCVDFKVFHEGMTQGNATILVIDELVKGNMDAINPDKMIALNGQIRAYRIALFLQDPFNDMQTFHNNTREVANMINIFLLEDRFDVDAEGRLQLVEGGGPFALDDAETAQRLLVPYGGAGQLQLYEDDTYHVMHTRQLMLADKYRALEIERCKQHIKLLEKDKYILMLQHQSEMKGAKFENALMLQRRELEETFNDQIGVLQIEMRKSNEVVNELQLALTESDKRLRDSDTATMEAKRHNENLRQALKEKMQMMRMVATQLASFEGLISADTKEKIKDKQPLLLGDAKSSTKGKMSLVLADDPKLEMEIFRDVFNNIPQLLERNDKLAEQLLTCERQLADFLKTKEKMNAELERVKGLMDNQDKIIESLDMEVAENRKIEQAMREAKGALEGQLRKMQNDYTQIEIDLEQKKAEVQNIKKRCTIEVKEKDKLNEELNKEYEKKKKIDEEKVEALKSKLAVKDLEVKTMQDMLMEAERQIGYLEENYERRKVSRTVAVGMTPIPKAIRDSGTSPNPTPVKMIQARRETPAKQMMATQTEQSERKLMFSTTPKRPPKSAHVDPNNDADMSTQQLPIVKQDTPKKPTKIDNYMKPPPGEDAGFKKQANAKTQELMKAPPAKEEAKPKKAEKKEDAKETKEEESRAYDEKDYKDGKLKKAQLKDYDPHIDKIGKVAVKTSLQLPKPSMKLSGFSAKNKMFF